MTEMSVDLPTFGYPTSPTSASSFNSRRKLRSSPGRPSSCSRGAWCVEVANCALPRPPRPPRAITTRSSAREKSWTFSPVSSSKTIVPTGTFSTIPSPSRPVFFAPSPCRPRSALYSGLKRKCTRVLWRSLDSIQMSPPPIPADAAVRDVDALVGRMTLDEKASLTAGVDSWHTGSVPRLGIPAVKFTDGPNGARGETRGDGLSITPSVCIPSETALGATWDPDLVAETAAMVARQARDKGARVLLAPTVNLHRHPLWGRNFEAFSEDPILTAKLAIGYIRGVQAQGVVATVKHFVGNETEFERNTSSSVVDERTLRELYLLPFEYAVKVADVLALMTSYNRVNGCHSSDDPRLLTDILRREWGFGGVVMTDWWALVRTLEAARAGLDLEMPGPPRSFGAALATAVRAGDVDESLLDAKVRRLLTVLNRVGALEAPVGQPERPVDRPEDRALNRRVAADALVLLSNRGVLPLAPSGLRRIALVGPNADRPVIMGGGSAGVIPHYILSPLTALRERFGDTHEIVHEAGADEAGVQRAVDLARGADAAIVIVGSDPGWETEDYDRETMDLPGQQDDLVRRILRATPSRAGG